MSYQNAYQEVIAGRVREDEQIAFFGKNRVATPVKTVTFASTGGKKQPTLEKNYLQHPGVGKPGTTSDVIEAYLDNPYNVAE